MEDFTKDNIRAVMETTTERVVSETLIPLVMIFTDLEGAPVIIMPDVKAATNKDERRTLFLGLADMLMAIAMDPAIVGQETRVPVNGDVSGS